MKDKVDGVGSRDPAAQAAPRIPIGFDGDAIVEAEPACAARPLRIRVERDDFQIDGPAELQQVIIGAHIAMALPERDIEIEAGSNMGDAFDQRRRNHGEMVERQHVLASGQGGRVSFTIVRNAVKSGNRECRLTMYLGWFPLMDSNHNSLSQNQVSCR